MSKPAENSTPLLAGAVIVNLKEERPEDRSRQPSKQDYYLTPDGREKPDARPLSPPLGYKPQPSLFEQVRSMVRGELSRIAESQGMETAEEADDFDVGDDYDPTAPYEYNFEPLEPEAPAPNPLRGPPVETPAADAPSVSPIAPKTTIPPQSSGGGEPSPN